MMILPKLHVEFERWKFNKEYGVWVSNFGNFKDKHKHSIPVKVFEANGYLSIKTKHGNRLAHRLVMYTWCPIEDREAFTVDHRDHNKRNNRVDNLEWCTRNENIIRASNDLIKGVAPITNAGEDMDLTLANNDPVLFDWLKNSNDTTTKKWICENNLTSKSLFTNGIITGTSEEIAAWLMENDSTYQKAVNNKPKFFLTLCKKARSQSSFYCYKWSLVQEQKEEVVA